MLLNIRNYSSEWKENQPVGRSHPPGVSEIVIFSDQILDHIYDNIQSW